MLSESHRGRTDVSASELLDLKQWQKVQNLFAEIIGANLWLIEPTGTCLTTPSKITGFCSDFIVSPSGQKISPIDCVFKAFQSWVQKKESSYQCPHHLNFFSSPIRYNKETLGVIAVGPIIVGKREDEKTYRAICEKQDIDSDVFLDRIREINIFSYNRIRVVIDFLKELEQYLLRLACQRKELERLAPGFSAAEKKGEGFFSTTYSSLLSNYLLDVASEVVQADSGSVLLVDEMGKRFLIESARGIRPEILKKRQLPLDGVAGWVAFRKKPVLIGSASSEDIPKTRLKRPKIKSSMVVPLQFQKRILGVFCLNTKSANKRFNKSNLLLLDQLGKLASVALSRVSAN